MNNKDMKNLFSSESNEWSTPQDFFDKLNEEFHFNLDPCSTDKNAKCEKHFTIHENGLSQNWGGTEYFAIHHTAEKLVYGLRNVMKKVGRATPLSFC